MMKMSSKDADEADAMRIIRNILADACETRMDNISWIRRMPDPNHFVTSAKRMDMPTRRRAAETNSALILLFGSMLYPLLPLLPSTDKVRAQFVSAIDRPRTGFRPSMRRKSHRAATYVPVPDPETGEAVRLSFTYRDVQAAMRGRPCRVGTCFGTPLSVEG